jgi:hypothetical protein
MVMMAMILINVMVTIVISYFDCIRNDAKKQDDDTALLQLFMTKVRSIIGPIRTAICPLHQLGLQLSRLFGLPRSHKPLDHIEWHHDMHHIDEFKRQSNKFIRLVGGGGGCLDNKHYKHVAKRVFHFP